ncbi:MAG TPA: indole-3-glycerol phosphate synthase TrpC [Clostridia bacterium]|nr:indole-3-glycerol phosphate synthase TrpC [Clostridia bacterium]
MILETLARSTRLRVQSAKKKIPFDELKSRIFSNGEAKRFNNREGFAFEKALKSDGLSFICEVKKASPSKGIISPDFPYKKIAGEYEKAGADAISVLTEPENFKGSDIYLKEISESVNIPVLRKDFIIDEYQLYESKLLGADTVLLICALLDTDTLKRYIEICDMLELSALVEAHTKEEAASAIEAGARVIGVNNRDLKTFEVDIRNCIALRELVPKNIIYVAESGIQSREDIALLEKEGVDAVLIGEALMKSADKKAMLSYLKGGKA